MLLHEFNWKKEVPRAERLDGRFYQPVLVGDRAG
jgi:hypothetical protein